MKRLVAVVSVGAAIAACARYATYGYQYHLGQEFGGGEEPEAAPREARDLLRTAKTVAFFPPDICLNTETGERKAKELRASCGVLLSTLERAAGRAGYEVLSWQNLRGLKRPIDFAREANVDVLFEINEFDLGAVSDAEIQRSLTFFEETESGDKPLDVPQQTAIGCKSYADQAQPPQPAALTATIDIKTVSVADGRARWRYRKTLSQSLGRQYPRVPFRAPETPHWYDITAVTIGAVALGIGGGLGLAEGITGNGAGGSDRGFDSHGWATNLVIGGAVLMTAGLVVDYFVVGMVKPEPEATLCNGIFAVPYTDQNIAHVGVSSEHTFTERTVSNPLQKEQDAIRDTMIAQFIDELKDVHANVAKPAPAAPPPAPTP